MMVIGDLMLDLYVWGKVERISPEAPVQVLKVESEEPRPGGAANVAGNLAVMGANVVCCGVIGGDSWGRLLCRLLGKWKIDTSGILHDKDRPTTVKTRMVAYNQQLLRVDKEEVHGLDRSLQKRLLAYIRDTLPACDAVLFSDYGKGTIPDELIGEILSMCIKNGKTTLVDPALRRDPRIYSGCTVLKPNTTEAAAASGIDIKDQGSLEASAARLLKISKAQNLVITQGSEGMTIFRTTHAPLHVPALSRPVFDVTGAGDTVLSLLGYVLSGGGTIEEAAEIANVAAGIVVGKVGATPVAKSEIIHELLGAYQPAAQKIKTLGEISALCKEHRRRNQKIVFTNGCFDLLHVGHIKLFEFAKTNGEILIVGLNSDSSVKKLKGPKRPVLNQNERAYILSAIEQVDYIVIFDELTPLRLIRAVKPDTLVKGADYTKDKVVGGEFVESYGGQVKLAPLVEGVSSTKIMSRISRDKKI
jgi:D-beta-D-heptose 7-phosphate kinase/D-beta-D-heptose 1-phosphate adenosyltransferase